MGEILEMPHLIEIQLDSFKWFCEEGLKELFQIFSAIEDGELSLEFLEHSFDEPKYSPQECKERDLAYEAPLKVRVRLINKRSGEIKEKPDQFLGNVPIMTERGTFIINGAERVVVSQLVRCPGVYFERTMDFSGKMLYTAQLIPDIGPWIELGTDTNDVISVRIGKSRKLPVTLLLRALSPFDIPERYCGGKEIPKIECATDAQLLELFGEHEEKINPSRDDLLNRRALEDIVDPETGKIIVKAYDKIDRDAARGIENLGLKELEVLFVNRYIENTLREEKKIKTFSPEDALKELYRRMSPGGPFTKEKALRFFSSIFQDVRRYDLTKAGRYKINEKLGLNLPVETRVLTKQDLIGIINRLIDLSEGTIEEVDDIDHLGNKKVRGVGELLLDQFRIGFLRMERVIRGRMAGIDPEKALPERLININPLTAVIRSFFGSSQLSQFMDQVNPLAELTHKRRLSVLGMGGLTRQSAKLEVRDVHYSHYGRICPIETPEGPNIGLITSLTTYARVNQYGFIETPYRRVIEGKVTDEIVYLTSDKEDRYKIAPADTPVAADGKIEVERVVVRYRDKYPEVSPQMVELIDLSPRQIVSVSTSLIPFFENNDSNRALMGSNMQRQAVPLINPEVPLVSTGVEHKAAKDSGALVVAKNAGIVKSVSADEIVIQGVDGLCDSYKLDKFVRSNQVTCINQRPVVAKGERIKKNQVIAEGPCADGGKLALGRNLLVAFMPWEGYNYEDAVLISEKLVKDDILSSIHIEKYQIEARDTKLGPEEITQDIPDVGEDSLKNLDERGIVRLGAEVNQEEILVGKVAPKGQDRLSAEEKLVIQIFGKQAEEVRNVSLRMPHGQKGKIIGISEFSRFKYQCPDCGEIQRLSTSPHRKLKCPRCIAEMEKVEGDELLTGVNHLVKVYVAQRRKITEGDKLAGRHGNKGVVAKILPEEAMPFLPDGTPVDIVLNPLGVPSRMNIGQILETHLSFIGKQLGHTFECPIFEGVKQAEILEGLKAVCEGLRKHALENYLSSELGLPVPVGIEERAWVDILEDLEKTLMELDKERINELMEKLAVPADGSFKSKPQAIIERIKENLNKRIGFDEHTGKCILYDGRNGEPFNLPATVGYIYMMKLIHLVEDKIHARSTGPYSLVTQQPLGGKAQMGGQRLGEMEVWALEAYGAAHSLQEMLTIKSDDTSGRVKTFESIIKGESIEKPAIPESFKILIKQLKGLGLSLGGPALEPLLEEERAETDSKRSGKK